MVKNRVPKDLKSRKKSIGEDFESHADLTALNPIRSLPVAGDFVTEGSALSAFLLMLSLLPWLAI